MRMWGNPCSVMTKVQDYSLKVSEFKLQYFYYIHFWTNTLQKSEPSYTSMYGLNSITAFLLQGWLWL